MKIRIDPADKYFSLCVRERAGNRCEACSRSSDHYRIDCSHLFSRRHMSTRYHPQNAFAHCFQCHQAFGGDPVSFARWAEKRLGPAKVEAMHILSSTLLKLSKRDKEYIAKHYRAEHKAMLDKRKAGFSGYLQFNHWGDV